MPTPSSNRLRLQPLEDRSLPSTTFHSFGGIVINGTDAHDRITLTRLDEDRVRVTIQSFHDPEWTRPTSDPVQSYEVAAGLIVGFNGGAGHDRVEIADPVFREVFVRGTSLPDDGDQLLSYVAVPADPSAPATLTDGVELIDGAPVEMFFNGYVYLDPIEMVPEPVITLPIVPDVVSPEGVWTGPFIRPANEVELASADGMVDLIGVEEETWSDGEFDAGPDGDTSVNWVASEGDFSDPWVERADELPIGWPDGESSYEPDESEVPVEEVWDEWLENDLENEGS